jgi:hypothetical protein
MGIYGPIQWPPRSPDLNALDLFLWDYIRGNVYLTLGNSIHPGRIRKKDSASLRRNMYSQIFY